MLQQYFLALLAVASAAGSGSTNTTLYDFGNPRSVDGWVSINDGVMGGVSSGRLEATGESTAVFTGNVSLANNGGFASVRSRPREADLREFAGLALRVRGDGQRYKVNLKTESSLDGILYRAAFDTRRNEWQTVYLRFDEFAPAFRGRAVPGADPLQLERVISIGLMISDKQRGPFRLELARIDAFRD